MEPGDVVVAIGVDMDAGTNDPGLALAPDTAGDGWTYLHQGDGRVVGYATVDATHTAVRCVPQTGSSTNHAMRVAFVVIRNGASFTLADSSEGAVSPLSATGTGELVVALGRGIATTGTDVVTLSGIGFQSTAQQSGEDPISAGYGNAGTYGLSWPDPNVSSGGLYLVGIT